MQTFAILYNLAALAAVVVCGTFLIWPGDKRVR